MFAAVLCYVDLQIIYSTTDMTVFLNLSATDYTNLITAKFALSVNLSRNM
jgi:hypothetical protein